MGVVKNYGIKLKKPEWQRVRLRVMERDKWTCQLCQDDLASLNVHHTEYAPSGNPWDANPDTLFTICEHCHDAISRLKKIPLLDFTHLKVCKLNLVGDGIIIFISHYSNYYILVYDALFKHVITLPMKSTMLLDVIT